MKDDAEADQFLLQHGEETSRRKVAILREPDAAADVHRHRGIERGGGAGIEHLGGNAEFLRGVEDAAIHLEILVRQIRRLGRRFHAEQRQWCDPAEAVAGR